MRSHTSGLARDLEVVEVLSSAEAFTLGGLGVNRVSELTGRDKGQISRVLGTLAATGLVDRDTKTRKYSLGHRFYSLSMRTREAHLALQAESRLSELVAQTQETAHLNVLRGGRVLTIKTIVAADAVRRSGWDGVLSNAGITASGRAMLAGLTDSEIELWWQEHALDDPLPILSIDLPKPAEPINPKTRRAKKPARNLKAFMALLQDARDLGYALSEEFQSGIVDAAAPVRDSSNLVVAALSVGASKDRIGDQTDQLGQLVSAAALRLSVDLGAPIVGPA
ncbi:MAG: IclR family transcriptional regulator C-terminal domain-containing protein [Aquiluna sp.]|jgi:DNA-binding IclR family transcriptional regulator